MTVRSLRRRVKAFAALILAMTTAMACGASAAGGGAKYSANSGSDLTRQLRVLHFVGDAAVELMVDSKKYPMKRGERLGAWTFMGSTSRPHNYAVFEDFHSQDGHILLVDTEGVQIDLPKSAESDLRNEGNLYLGHARDEVSASRSDLLGNEILSRATDPEYASVSDVLPKMETVADGAGNGTSMFLEGFVGTPDSTDKIYFSHGGRTANFDPASFQPSIEKVREAGAFRQGLVGGYLPAIRFVYPEPDGAWTEMIAFAPFRLVNDNDRVQPVWYRVSRIEHGTLKWCRYIDSYQPFPMSKDKAYTVENGQRFYDDLVKFRVKWDQIVNSGMKINVPDKRLENMARFSLVGSIMTRAGGFPKYGVSEWGSPGYGANEHDGFPDTFTDETDAALDWGLFERAGRYIDNYLEKFVRDNGAILYRGPETGQYGRMLAIFAKYLNGGGDVQVLIKNKNKVESIAGLLLTMRADATKLSEDDPAHGMLSGWSEADSSLRPDPSRYTQPYFSNSTEAVRGFEDFGKAWEALGSKTANANMIALGRQLVREAGALRQDVAVSVLRTTIVVDGNEVLAPIAGVKVLPDAALARDEDDPQWQYYRVFMEMSHSGVLSKAQLQLLRNYLSNHHGLILGMPATFDNKGQYQTFGFLSSGYAYSLVQTDNIREALLMLYSEMAHQYTRGTWVAPEERDPLSPGWLRYSTSAQMTIAPIVRWLLVFEDAETNTLWLGKGVPTQWLEDGQSVAVTGAPTKWGKVSFAITSHADAGRIEAEVRFPDAGISAETKLRLRVGNGLTLKSVTLNGTVWPNFDPTTQVVMLPPGTARTANIIARY
jgi:hypothetical protein